MTGIFVSEIRGLAKGYQIANSCGLLPNSRLLEAFPISSERFIFLLESSDFSPAEALCAGHPCASFPDPHPDLLKALFNLQGKGSGPGLAIVEGGSFPDLVVALQLALESGLSVVDVRYGKLLQGRDLMLLAGELSDLDSFQRKLATERLAVETRFIKEVCVDLQAIIG